MLVKILLHNANVLENDIVQRWRSFMIHICSQFLKFCLIVISGSIGAIMWLQFINGSWSVFVDFYFQIVPDRKKLRRDRPCSGNVSTQRY